MAYRGSLVLLFVVVAGCREEGAGRSGGGRAIAFSPEEKKAAQIAEEHVAKHEMKWGEASQVTRLGEVDTATFKGEEVYSITFPTPEKEIRVLGPRTIMVDLATGRAMTVMRD